jgi:acyl-coenzyme A synthetase/AMP-(fatty) acid ligase
MLKVSGVWVRPIEIERVLSEHPAVQEAAVIFHKVRTLILASKGSLNP